MQYNIKEYYHYVERQIGDKLISGIKLIKPEKWNNFIFAFTGGKFGKVDSTGQVPVEYTFNILDNSCNISAEEMLSKEFSNLLGDIFVDMVKDVQEHETMA